MKSLQEKRLKFLNDTASFYNLGNRAYDKTIEMCVYTPTPTSPGCAIGRHLPLAIAERLEQGEYKGVNNEEVFEQLPAKLTELGQDFLEDVQGLHDYEHYWTEEGISEEGIKKVEWIKSRYCV